MGGGNVSRRRRSAHYDGDYIPSDEEDYDGSGSLMRRGQTQLVLRDKEDALVERALERIRRARALGKTNVKLSRAEIDALERLERGPNPPRTPPMPLPAPKAQPKGKKAIPTKQKAVEPKKPTKGGKSASNSPKPRPKDSRVRGQSTASNRSGGSAKDDALVPYPITPDDYQNYPGYFGRPPPNALQREARSGSSQSARGQHPQAMQPYQHPYYAHHYNSHPDVLYSNRPQSGSSRGRPDPADPNWEPRARSTSSLVDYPLNQLPQQAVAGTGRVPRFDPSDPRYASPARRVVSGPAQSMARRQQEELFLPRGDDSDVMQYLADSPTNDGAEGSSSEDEDSDESGQGVQVNVEERGGNSYAIQTRAGARSTGPAAGKAVAKRRR